MEPIYWTSVNVRLENVDIMNNFKNQNFALKYFKQQPMAIFASAELSRSEKIAKLNNLPADEDPWLVAMIKELADSENDYDR